MQFKLVSVLALATLAVATPTGNPPPPTPTTPASQCNTGNLQCCNSVQASNTAAVGVIAALLGIVLGPVTALVGLNCSPLSIIGIGGNSCTAQPVCCSNNSFNGVIAIGCTPVNINL